MGHEPASERPRAQDLRPGDGLGRLPGRGLPLPRRQLVAAWTREGKLESIAERRTTTWCIHARRLVAQRCLYGVDKNPFAVNLAKLSLWLVTLAKDYPFTFLDHALRHGDSLVGLDFDQITSFHWKPGKQLELCRKELEGAPRRGHRPAPADPRARRRERRRARPREGAILLRDAEDALSRVA